MSTSRFIPGIDPPARPRDHALFFAAAGLELLVAERDGTFHIPRGADLPALTEEAHYLGTLDGTDCYAVALPQGAKNAENAEPAAPSTKFVIPAGMKLVVARSLYGHLDEDLFAVAGRAVAIAEWDATHRFCGRCGEPTLRATGERARRCSACRTPFYPRISPAVIVLVTREHSMLLARSARFPVPFFSTLAGFLEAGESLEEALVREVKEEVGIDVHQIRYFGSQPWPFGRSLMVGFTAEYAGGDIRVDGEEIVEAAWFTADNLPRLPPPLSIARQLIDSFLAKVRR